MIQKSNSDRGNLECSNSNKSKLNNNVMESETISKNEMKMSAQGADVKQNRQMRNRFKKVVAIVLCGVVLASCGGGGGKSGVKENKYLGKLPAIYADYSANKEAHKEKQKEKEEKLARSGKADFGKLMKLDQEDKDATKAMKEKLETDIANEIAKIEGNEIPVLISEGLKASSKFFYAISAKLVADADKRHISVAIAFTAKDDVVIPRWKSSDYAVYCVFAASDGSPITMSVESVDLFNWSNKDIPVTKGELFKERELSLSSLTYSPEKYADFAGIQFMTKEEYSEMLKNRNKE